MPFWFDLRNTPSGFHKSMGFVLQLMMTMREFNFDIVTSLSVFGDQHDLLFFGYKSVPDR